MPLTARMTGNINDRAALSEETKMRKLIPTIATAGLLTVASWSVANAAPVPGFEAFYSAAFAACTPPAGTPEACEAAINAYSAALIAAGVDPAVALASFTELRAEVAAAGGGAVIDALFEELLPESGATTLPPPAGGAGGETSSGTPVPSSPVT